MFSGSTGQTDPTGRSPHIVSSAVRRIAEGIGAMPPTSFDESGVVLTDRDRAEMCLGTQAVLAGPSRA